MADLPAEDVRLLRETDDTDQVRAFSVLWRVLNRVLLSQAAQHSGWHMVTHEDLCARPAYVFRLAFQASGLPWTDRIERHIHHMTASDNPGQASGRNANAGPRSSASLPELAKRSVSLADRRLVHAITGEVAAAHYDEASFNLG